MGIFSSGADQARKVRKLIAANAAENKRVMGEAGTYAEGLLSPYMLDPSVMGELQGVVTGQGADYRRSPIYQQFYDVGREAMLEDMAGTGSLYSGVRMEGMRDLGQNAFANYLSTLQGLAGFGRDTASQLGGIRMGTAQGIAGINQQSTGDIANVRMAQSAQERGLGLGVLDFAGKIIGSAMEGGGSAAGGAAAASDVALKKDIEYIGKKNGHDWFKWKWNDKAEEIGLSGEGEGVIAQLVSKYMPEAVTEKDGYLAVHYSMLGV